MAANPENEYSFENLIDLVHKNYATPMDDLIEVFLRGETGAETHLEQRREEMLRFSDNAALNNPQEFNRKNADMKALNVRHDLLLNRFTENPEQLSNAELYLLALLMSKNNQSWPALYEQLKSKTIGEHADPKIVCFLGNFYASKSAQSGNYEWHVDKAKALAYFEQAIGLNYPPALTSKGNFIKEVGRTTPADYSLIQQAADQGDFKALLQMASIYSSTTRINDYFNDDFYKATYPGLQIDQMELAVRAAKAEEYTIRACKLGASTETLDRLVTFYEGKGDISKAAKCMALMGDYGAWNALSRLYHEHSENPAVVYHRFHRIVNGLPSQVLKTKFLEIASRNLDNDPSVYTEYDALLAQEPWGDYSFQVQAAEPEDKEIMHEKIYVYPAEEIGDPFDVLHVSLQPDEEVTEDIIKGIQERREVLSVPVLIRIGQGEQCQFMLYGNTDGAEWKLTPLNREPFVSLQDLEQGRPEIMGSRLTSEMKDQIRAKQAHTPFLGYALVGENGKVQRHLIPGVLLGREGFEDFSKKLKDAAFPLTEEAKSAFLKAIALQGSIPRERISSLLDNSPLTQQIHQRKLNQAAIVLQNLGGVSAIDSATIIMEYANINLSRSEITAVKQIAKDSHSLEARQGNAFFARPASAPAPLSEENEEEEEKQSSRAPGKSGLGSPD